MTSTKLDSVMNFLLRIQRYLMPQITTLVTGAGVNTPVTGQSQLEGSIVIGDVDTANPLQGLNIMINGQTTIDIQGSAPLVTFFAKLFQPIIASAVGLVFKVATGRIYGSTSYRFTNAGATTPIVTAWSDLSTAEDSAPVLAVTDTVNPNSNTTYKDFTALGISPAANVGSFDVTFADGTTQQMSVIDVDARFASTNDTEANGRLESTTTGFDNRAGDIKSVKVNATTAVVVLKVNLPAAFFRRMMAKLQGK